MGLDSWQTRVVEEKAELDEKLAKLDAFLLTETFSNLDPYGQYLLFEQSRHMSNYSWALGKRIGNFK